MDAEGRIEGNRKGIERNREGIERNREGSLICLFKVTKF
jgi:hypothetical protein